MDGVPIPEFLCNPGLHGGWYPGWGGHKQAWELKENVVDINAAEAFQNFSWRYQHQQDVLDAASKDSKVGLDAGSKDYKAGLDQAVALQTGYTLDDQIATRSLERQLQTMLLTQYAIDAKAFNTQNLMISNYTLTELAKLDNDSLESALRNNPEMVEALGKAFSSYAPYFNYAYPYPPTQANSVKP